jgi:glyoxylase-like metal-dependent hydrolase (beta-lactamase superfamily II)
MSARRGSRRRIVLWDTGAVARLQGGMRIAESVVFRVTATLRGQLAEIGVSPNDVDAVGLSHLHVDHVGNAGLFPRATVLLQLAEYDAGFGADPERFTLIPDAYAALDRGRIEVVVGDHDVFGDARVVLAPLPGHTPGHQGLLVDLPETGPVLLAGDIAYSAADYAQAAVRAGNVDIEASRRSIEAAKALERDRGVAVWLHHDREAQGDIVTAPSFYG